MKLCKCGCGQPIEIKPWHKHHGTPSYIKGHYWNGKKRAKETNQKVSEGNKGRTCFWKGRKRPKHSKWMMKNCQGDTHPAWKGGISCEPYCDVWQDKDYKESIKKRDGYKCLNPDCKNISCRLTLHHINYNKKDCSHKNLITLCLSCNGRANADREWHESWYLAILHRRYGY